MAAREVFLTGRNGRAKRDDVSASVLKIPQTIPVTPVRPPTPEAPPTPIPVLTFISSEEMQKALGGLAEVVNQHLNAATTNEVRLETTPDNLVEYLQTLQIPYITKVESPAARIENGRLIVTSKITGSVKIGIGPVSKDVEVSPVVEAILEKDLATGQLKVSTYSLSGVSKVEELALRALAGKYIGNLDGLMRDRINKEIDPNWALADLQIAGDKLAFDFRKK